VETVRIKNLTTVAGAAGVVETEVMGTPPSTAPDTRPGGWHLVGAAGVIVGAIVVAYLLWRGLDRPLFNPAAGYVPLVGVVLLAQAIERLLEPVSEYLVPKLKQETDAATKTQEAVEKGADPAVPTAAVQSAANDAAKAKVKLTKRENERKLWFWAIATAVAAVAAATAGVFLVNSVGTITKLSDSSRSHVAYGLDLAVTALIVGAGTKPLHDLIASVNKPDASAT
jgi:hypothetical protein